MHSAPGSRAQAFAVIASYALTAFVIAGVLVYAMAYGVAKQEAARAGQLTDEERARPAPLAAPVILLNNREVCRTQLLRGRLTLGEFYQYCHRHEDLLANPRDSRGAAAVAKKGV